MSGFTLHLMRPGIDSLRESKVRIFAVSEGGVASELVNTVDGVELGARP